MTDTSKNELYEQLAQKVEALEHLLHECEEFAEKHDLDFCISPAYGMGGTFRKADHHDTEWYGETEGTYKWFPSSESC